MIVTGAPRDALILGTNSWPPDVLKLVFKLDVVGATKHVPTHFARIALEHPSKLKTEFKIGRHKYVAENLLEREEVVRVSSGVACTQTNFPTGGKVISGSSTNVHSKIVPCDAVNKALFLLGFELV